MNVKGAGKQGEGVQATPTRSESRKRPLGKAKSRASGGIFGTPMTHEWQSAHFCAQDKTDDAGAC